jgi:general secretion pathway protein I
MKRQASPMQRASTTAYTGGFTLIEVLVALMIVALGMGAVLSALSSSAFNVSALRDKTLAQWIALNRIADTRLSLQVPANGTTQGDIKNFGNGDWHWQQDVIALTQIPGLLQITVSVRRNAAATPATPTTSNATAPNWLASVVGFRGTGLAPASGEVPDWGGVAFSVANSGNASGNTGGNVANPGTPTSPSSPATTPATTPTTTPANPSGSTGSPTGIP